MVLFSLLHLRDLRDNLFEDSTVSVREKRRKPVDIVDVVFKIFLVLLRELPHYLRVFFPFGGTPELADPLDDAQKDIFRIRGLAGRCFAFGHGIPQILPHL